MKRTILILITAAITLFGTALSAQQNEPESSAGQMLAMQQMHAQMQKMQRQMQQINETQDPDERKRLLQDHMQSMHEGMEMMGRMSAMHEDGGKHDHPDSPGPATTDCAHAAGMERRMKLMRMMMRQMNEHQMHMERSPGQRSRSHEHIEE